MSKMFGKWVTEKKVFYAILILNILLLFSVRFYPSMDGPSHLYNSNLIGHLIIEDSSVLDNYFILSNAILPNWIGHFVLSLFNIFIPAWLAEKALLVLYLLGISVSFRFLIKQLCPENIILSVFIFPFAYSFLFHLGFYNYCLSFIFLFSTLAYWIKNYESEIYLKYIILFILLLLTYFSAILTFFFLGLCLGLFTISYSFKNYRSNNYSLTVKRIAGELILLFLTSLPCLIFSIIFINSVAFLHSKEYITTVELLKWLNDVRCIIVYNYIGEEKLTEQFLHIAVAIVSISLFIRFYNIKYLAHRDVFRISDVLIIPLIFTLILMFTVPNGSNAGMMSDRYCLLAFIFFITWVSSQPLPKVVSYFFMILIITLHTSLIFKQRYGTIKNLDKNAIVIYKAAEYIEENSVVLPVNMSDNWIEPHFSNYLGVDKPLVILENYEASVGWFPVKWNTKEMPRLKLGEHDRINGIQWASNINSPHTKQIDYVFLYGNLNKVNEPKWSDLKAVLKKYYILVFTDDNYVAIFKTK